MTTPASVGAELMALKLSTGWTWAHVADEVGATSGDYVRKVATGKKPGHNLVGNVAEYLSTGSVTARVPRRTTAAGTVARVRAARSTGAPSRVPDEAAERTPTASARQLYRGANGRLGWSRDFGIPQDASSTVRADGADAVVAELRSVARGQGSAGQRDVELLVTVRFGDGVERTQSLGRRPVSDVVAGIRGEGGDVLDWIESEFDGRYGVSAGNIVAITVNVLA